MSQESLQEATSVGEFSPESSQSTPVTSQSEKMFTQSEVDKIAGKVRRETIEKFRTDQPVQQNTYSNPSPNLSLEDFRRTAIEEAQKAAAKAAQEQIQAEREQILQGQYMAEGQRIADEFRSKIEADKERFPELKDKLGKTNLAAFPAIIHLANSMENTAAIMNELFVENPGKLASINSLAQIDPSLAIDAVTKLSKSISINEKAAQSKVANEPLSQLRPSTIGVDNGQMSVTDYRRIFK